MNKKVILLLGIPMLLIGCNKGSVDLPKSPFKDDNYQRIGMESEYKNNEIAPLNSDEYNKLKTSINKDFLDYDKKAKRYVREEETRDLKAAYFGTNLGAVNLCFKTSRKDENTAYSDSITTKLVNTKKEEQVMNSRNTIKTEQEMDDYLYKVNDNEYYNNRLLKNNNETPTVTKTEIAGATDDSLLVLPYSKDIKNNFVIKSRSGKAINFSVLADNNKAVYGKTNINNQERFIIREAISDFVPYSTTIGDTFKAVDNYFYECLLEAENGGYRFTNFRFYHELLILSEAYGDETKVPVLYLERPMLVEYSEIKYTISYDNPGKFPGVIPEPTK